jgi:hypothetical protein
MARENGPLLEGSFAGLMLQELGYMLPEVNFSKRLSLRRQRED